MYNHTSSLARGDHAHVSRTCMRIVDETVLKECTKISCPAPRKHIRFILIKLNYVSIAAYIIDLNK
jgi:hypothetical protein